jgi:adenylosuccinate lyase
MEIWQAVQKGHTVSFKEKLLTDPVLAKTLTPKALAACFDEKFYIRHAKKIWQRVLKA